MSERPGLLAREWAAALVEGVLKHKRPFDDQFERDAARPPYAALEARDKAFAFALAATTLRRLGEARYAIDRFLAKRLPKSAGLAETILLTAAAQLLFMDVAAHAAIDLAVATAKADASAKHFAGLINAVLRKVAGERPAAPDTIAINTPPWLLNRWIATYGEADARRIAETHLHEPPLDLSVKADPELWAERLGGITLPGGTVRLDHHDGRIDALPGFAEGDWWVQDAASAMPARLLGDVNGKRVLDLCAAPGGKTAQLAAAGARVTALDISAPRMERLKANLARLGLPAECVVADALAWRTQAPFDAILLDAPCSATGTIRRHPDVPYLKTETQIADLARLQAALLTAAATQLKPGGVLVYSTCSLEPEEGERRAEAFLSAHPNFGALAVAAVEGPFATPTGALRTLPFHALGHGNGLDGFFVMRFRAS